MRSAQEKHRRARCLATFRPVALIAFATPLLLSACASTQTGTKTTSLVMPQQSGASGVDAYGYAPVRIAAFADGSRVAQPSPKPNAAKLEAAASGVAPGKTSAIPKAAAPVDPNAALAADVAERKAATAAPDAVAAASAELAAKAAKTALTSRPETGAKVAEAGAPIDPAAAVPATVAAVTETADAVKVAAVATTGAVKGAAVATTGAVKDAAVATTDAVKVAALETTARAVATTSRAVDAVSDRINDTFSGSDTITGSAAIDDLIERSAAENGIPSELAYAVVRVESHYNPNARGSGVYGLSQIQPRTARSLGFSGPTSALYDPETNLRYGMKYLAGAWQKSGHDVCGAAMKYKGGHRTTVMSRSAAAYCANVKRHMAAIERRRGPANRETLLAAGERRRQIAVASKQSSRSQPDATATAIAAAAASPSARSVGTPNVSVASQAVDVPLTLPGVKTGRRLVQPGATPVTAALGLAE